jgi:hypothetical protein
MSSQLARRDKRRGASFRQSSTETAPHRVLRRFGTNLPGIRPVLAIERGDVDWLAVRTVAVLACRVGACGRIQLGSRKGVVPLREISGGGTRPGGSGDRSNRSGDGRLRDPSETAIGIGVPGRPDQSGTSGNRSLRCAGLYGSRRAAIPRAAPDDCGGWLTSRFLLHSIRRASVRGRISPRCINRANLQRWRHGKKLHGRPEACIRPSTSSGARCRSRHNQRRGGDAR